MVASVQENRVSIAITLATLVLCAFFLAQGTTRVFAARLLASEPAPAVPQRTSLATATPSFERTRDPAVILRRNIFDSSRGDLTAEPLPETGDDGVALEAWDPTRPPPKCSGSLRLVGSVMNYGYPDWSFAAIAGTSDGKTMLYREGSKLDGSRVLAVYPSSVVVSASSGACQLQMFEEEEAQRVPLAVLQERAPSRSPLLDARKAGLSDQELDEGIEKISDTRFNIQRSLVDKVLANQGSLMKTARVIPHEENGRVVGVKLYGIRRTSLLGRLGIRNGDMLRIDNMKIEC